MGKKTVKKNRPSKLSVGKVDLADVILQNADLTPVDVKIKKKKRPSNMRVTSVPTNAGSFAPQPEVNHSNSIHSLKNAAISSELAAKLRLPSYMVKEEKERLFYYQ